jgi:ribosomal protein S27AE
MLEAIAEKPPQAAGDDPSLHNNNVKPENCSKDSSAGEDAGFRAKDETERTVFPNRHYHQCPRCGSTTVIPSVPIRAQGERSSGRLAAYVDSDPEALFLKNRMYSRLLADVCGECGHVELRVGRPRDLYNHYLHSKVIKGIGLRH